MTCPSTVWINGKLWTIRERLDLYRNDEEFGNCVYHLLKIELDETQPDQHKRDSLWHEILHGIEHELNLKLTEKQVRQIASMQIAIMRDNPELMRYLLAQTEENE